MIVAAIAGLVFGAVWYGAAFRMRWVALTAGKTAAARPRLIVTACVAYLVMAWMFAGLIGHLGEISIRNALISAAFVWIGFVMTAMTVYHRAQAAPWSQTAIDGGHWLGVLLVMGLAIGTFGV